MRYMPTLRTPVWGSTVFTIGRVTKHPPSAGQHFRIGSAASDASAPVCTTCWHSPRPDTVRGNQRDIPASSGNARNLSANDGRGAMACRSNPSTRSESSPSDPTPSASAMRRAEPNMLVSTGNSVPVFSNSNALPPPGIFETRSVISAISSIGDTGAAMRTSSPSRSSSEI